MCSAPTQAQGTNTPIRFQCRKSLSVSQYQQVPLYLCVAIRWLPYLNRQTILILQLGTYLHPTPVPIDPLIFRDRLIIKRDENLTVRVGSRYHESPHNHLQHRLSSNSFCLVDL